LRTAWEEEAEMFAMFKEQLPSEHYLYYFEGKHDGMDKIGNLALDRNGRIIRQW
jgi:hypothetical protein